MLPVVEGAVRLLLPPLQLLPRVLLLRLLLVPAVWLLLKLVAEPLALLAQAAADGVDVEGLRLAQLRQRPQRQHRLPEGAEAEAALPRLLPRDCSAASSWWPTKVGTIRGDW